MDKIKEFLRRGYFPVQLPPGFTTNTFASSYKLLKGKWLTGDVPPSSSPERFSVARSSYNRRVTSIINPVPYYFLVKEIANYWQKIQNHYNKSRISLSRPKLNSHSLRAIEISKFSDLYEAKVVRSAGYKYALLTDISRFFPTIYTHTIPWALHGKDVAKRNHSKTAVFFGNILDDKSMGVQDRQTMGLPIGPDTSHVIAEIIAVAVDKALKTKLQYMPEGFRYVDDYCLFFDNQEEARRVLSELTQILSTYELQINPDKTKIIEVKDLVEDSWKYGIKHLDVSEQVHKQRDDLHKYFESLFTLEKRYKDESLVKYGLKKISNIIIKKQNWQIYEAYLLKCGYSFPNTLQVITTILSTYNYYKYPINKPAVERFCNTSIKSNSLSDGHSEIAWALWLAKELEISISKESIRAIETTSSSVCMLIALDLFHANLAKVSPRKEKLDIYATKDSLYSGKWLLAYEAGRRRWLHNKDDIYITDDDFFSELLKNNVVFYDSSRKCEKVFELKKNKEIGDDLSRIFESDNDINDYFDFQSGDDEYFDSVNVTSEDEEENYIEF